MNIGKSTRVFRAVLAAAILAGGSPLAAEAAGWEIGLKFGRTTFDQGYGDQQRYKSFDDGAAASAVEVAYFFGEYIGVQAGYLDLGTFRGTGSSCPFDRRTCREMLAIWAPADVEAEVTGWSLAAVPRWPFSERFAAYGKLGLFDRETALSSELLLVEGGRDFERLSDTDLLAALGLRYRVGKNLGALVEYQRAHLDTAALGLTWSF